jgi:hypothetical protein
MDLTLVQEGDYVVIGNSAQAQSGVYGIKAVSYSIAGGNITYNIDLDSDIGLITPGHIQLDNLAYTFFKPTKITILNGDRTVVVSQTGNHSLDVKIPATAITHRTPESAAYGRNTFNILSGSRSTGLTRLTLNTCGFTIDTFNVGDAVYVNSGDVNFTSGEKTITYASGNEIRYTDGALPVGITAMTGTVNSGSIPYKQQGPYIRESSEPLDSSKYNLYLTGSNIARIVAETLVNSSVAAGVSTNVEIVYPGDSGLGGEGLPTSGTGKLSDIVGVFDK